MAKIQFLFYQITDLTGLANVNDVADHMTDAVRTIISIMPEKYKTKCSAYTLMNADANTTLDLDDKGDILKVTREDADTGYYRNCREVKPELADLLNDSSSLYYATAGSPAYWTEDNSSGNATLFVKPNPTNTQPAKAYYVSYPSFVASGSGDWDIFNTLKTIPNFPDEAEKLVLLQTAMNILQQKLQEKSEDLPSDLAIPVMSVIITSLPSYTAPSAYIMPVAPASVDISFSVFANEMRQLQNVYERVLWLAQQCYPDYDVIGRMQAGPLIAMRVGDLFQYKVGMIRSLAIDWLGFNGGKWEMTAGMRMPQGCTVTMSYQIIHEDIPDRDYDFYGGPVGGLNAATERWRKISGAGNSGAFQAFENLDTGEVGYGETADGGGRLLDSGELNAGLGEMQSYLNKVKADNLKNSRGAYGKGGIKDVQRVPVGIKNEKAKKDDSCFFCYHPLMWV